MCLNTLQKEAQLNYLLMKTGMLIKEPRLDPWLAKILITELLWGKKSLKTDCKPVQTILTYQTQLWQELNNCSDIEALQASNNTVRKPRYVRVNTLLLSVKKAIAFFEDEGWSLLSECSNYTTHLTAVKNLSKPKFIQDFHIPEILIFPPDTSFHKHSAYQNGEIILQDKASCLPAQLLNPEPGSVVLDMCAAPGMKSSHLAALMENQGKIYAVEKNQRRYMTLCDQMKVTNSNCVVTLNVDALTLEADEYPDVEYVLVDPTCSGSGILDRQLTNENMECSPQRLRQLQAFQVFLLRHALLNFPNVKRVVYSTCSINPEENEQVIDELLEDVQNAYKLVSIKDMFKENWKNYSSNRYKCSDKCLYANFEVDLCNGFFVAVFERDFDVALPVYKRKGSYASKNVQENGESNSKEVGPVKKRKKRGKRKITKQAQETSMEENVLNVSTDSIKFINEIHTIDLENEDKPPAKKKPKKLIGKNRKQPNEGTRFRREINTN